MRNPYAKHLKEQVTLRINRDAIAYFKALAAETGIPYQNLISFCREAGSQGALEAAARQKPRAKPPVGVCIRSSPDKGKRY